MVTNCSKERPSSIVNETLKNKILILKDTSKELDFYADFKYISFIKFSLYHQKLRAWKNKNHTIAYKNHTIAFKNHIIAFSVSENPTVKVSSSYLQKCGTSYFLPEGRSRVRVCLFFFFLLFFPRGHSMDRLVLECRKRALSNGNEKFQCPF